MEVLAIVCVLMRLMPAVPDEIAEQLQQALAVIERHLGGQVHAIHLFGSAIDGGLKPHSDIDLLVTVDAALSPAARATLMTGLLAVSGMPEGGTPLRPLEVTVVVKAEVVPWRYSPRRELQFGEWLRADLKRGIVEPPIEDRDLAILLTKLRRHSVALKGPVASDLFDPVPPADFRRALHDTLSLWNCEGDLRGDERNIVLTLARIWFSACTGEIASKDAAARWVLERLPQQRRPVMETALRIYLGGGEDDLGGRLDEVLGFVRFCKMEITSSSPPR